MGKLYNFWPVPVGIEHFKDATDLNKQLREDIKTIWHKESPETRSGINVWQSGSFRDNYSSFDQLREMIKPIVYKFMVESGYHKRAMDYYSIDSFWVNYNESPTGYHVPHIHGTGNVDWTGIYYPYGDGPFEIKSTNHPDLGALVLYDPNGHMKHMVNPPDRVNLYPYYWLPMTINPQEGLLVVFPTWVVHGVAPKGYSKRRFSIGFNVEKDI